MEKLTITDAVFEVRTELTLQERKYGADIGIFSTKTREGRFVYISDHQLFKIRNWLNEHLEGMTDPTQPLPNIANIESETT